MPSFGPSRGLLVEAGKEVVLIAAALPISCPISRPLPTFPGLLGLVPAKSLAQVWVGPFGQQIFPNLEATGTAPCSACQAAWRHRWKRGLDRTGLSVLIIHGWPYIRHFPLFCSFWEKNQLTTHALKSFASLLSTLHTNLISMQCQMLNPVQSIIPPCLELLRKAHKAQTNKQNETSRNQQNVSIPL